MGKFVSVTVREQLHMHIVYENMHFIYAPISGDVL